MDEKVRVKKSQIYEENQDTSEKETKTETGSGQPPGRRPGPMGAAHPPSILRVGPFDFCWLMGCIQGL